MIIRSTFRVKRMILMANTPVCLNLTPRGDIVDSQLRNMSDTAILYLGPTSDIATVANGFPIMPGDPFGMQFYIGLIWVASDSDNTPIAYIET